jgi:hypothetical protein
LPNACCWYLAIKIFQVDSYEHEVIEICKSGKSGGGSYMSMPPSYSKASGKAGCLDDDGFKPSYEDDVYYSKPVPKPVPPVSKPVPKPVSAPSKPVPAPTFPTTGREDDEPTPAPSMDPYDTRSNDNIDLNGDGPTVTPTDSIDLDSGSNKDMDRNYHPPGGVIPGLGDDVLPPPPPITP